MNRDRQTIPSIPRSVALLSFGVILAGLTAQDASAQNNSLRNARPPEAAVTRPTSQQVAWPGPQVRTSLLDTAEPETPLVNPVLRRASLIAVELPEEEKIAVGDLVTIIIREDKRFRSDSKLESDREWKLEAELKKWFRISSEDGLVPQLFPNGTPGADFSFKNEYDGEGKVDRKDSLVTRIQARVLDVKPNGNLVLEARKRITVDDEDQVATLTGVCRSTDVTAQNSVLSTQVADLEINISHNGATRDASRRGWAMRLFDLLRPF